MKYHHKDTTSFIFDTTEQDFDQQVIQASHQQPILVDFWADWCAPCRMLTPILEKLVDEYQGKWLLAKVEVDDNMRLAGRYKLRGFPTVLVFDKGEISGRFSSAKPLHWVRDFIDQHLELD
jgi:thioredoxin 1